MMAFTGLRAVKGLARSMPAASLRLQSVRVTSRNASGGGGYNEPTGYLFGERPPPPGQKRKWEEWELPWYLGMFGGLALATVLYIYKPRSDIGAWAEKEARKRLDERGEWQYKPKQVSESEE